MHQVHREASLLKTFFVDVMLGAISGGSDSIFGADLLNLHSLNTGGRIQKQVAGGGRRMPISGGGNSPMTLNCENKSQLQPCTPFSHSPLFPLD